MNGLVPYVIVRDLGRMGFQSAYAVQKVYASELLTRLKLKEQNAMKSTLLLVEHEPVYTVGIRRDSYNEDDEVRLRSLGADFIKTNRGGLITFHGIGQLVAYPILYLAEFPVKKSIRIYVHNLEETIIRTCARFGLKAVTTKDTGVWIEDRKIAAIGIHASRYVTTHGISINCNVDLTWFDHIVPCGIPDKGVTSLSKELGRDVSIADVKPIFLKCFEEVFQSALARKGN